MTDRYASLKQGLVGCWIPSVSGSGLLLPDLSGRGNNGALTNMNASDWVSGQYGRALDFDGVNDTVNTNESNLFNFTSTASTFSVACWGLNRTSNYTNAIAKQAGGSSLDAGWSLSLSQDQPGGANAGHFFIASSFGIWLTVSFSFPQNQLQHVAIVCDMSLSGTNKLQAYVNGFLTGTKQASNVITSIGSNSRTLRIGSDSAGNFVHDGQLDDIRVYNRALSESEIKLLASEPGIGFKPAKKLSRFSQRFTYKPDKPRNYSVIRNRDPNYSTLRQGLVAAYCPSISGQGNVLPDLVGGNHGTLTNMDASDWVASGDGRALEFDGSNDYVSCGTSNNSLLVQSKAFSISAWIYLTSTTSDRTILTNAKITPNYDGMNFLSAAGKLRFDLGGDASPTFPLKRKETTSAVFSTGIWYHVAVTKPASAATSAISLYVNGVQPATTDAFNDTVADAVNNVNLQIAARDGANSLLQGQIDDLRLYSRALTEPEIRLLASKRGIGLEPRKPKITFTDLGVQKTYGVVRVKETDYATLRQGLVGAWCPSLPNGGSGNTLPDVSGYGNHGSLVNMSPDDWVSGQYGRALDFDGVNDYISFSQNAPMLPGSFAISLWFRPIALNTVNRYILSATTAANDNYYSVIWEYVDNTVEFYAGAGGNGAAFRSNSQITIGETVWYHIVYSFNQSSFTAWRNGTLQNTNTTAVSLNSVVNPSLWLATFSGGGSVANIQLDDVRIYNRALTESEIRLLASRPGIGLQPSPTRFIAREKKTGLRRILMTGQT